VRKSVYPSFFPTFLAIYGAACSASNGEDSSPGAAGSLVAAGGTAISAAGSGTSSSNGGSGTVVPGTAGASGIVGVPGGGTNSGNPSGGTNGGTGTLGAAGASGGTAGASGTSGPCSPGIAPGNTVSINLCSVEQTMDGFGAADTWAGPLTTAQNTLFWDPVGGIGLSLLRVGIDVNGTPLGSGAYADAMAADKFGVKVWGAPWSPPADDKDNANVNNGGHLCAAAGGSCTGSAYDSWATILAGFATTFKTKTGFALYGISAQNEPDFTASYASCIYTKEQMVAFVKVLGPKLAALSPPVNLIAAEPDSWSNLWQGDSFGTAILADSAASSAVNIIATHDYGHKADNDNTTTRPAPPTGTKQHIWETEMSNETMPASTSVDIAHGVQVATWIYAAITTGGASAWHYWWLINNASNNDGEGLLSAGGDITTAPKRLYALGNYSKFVRPGYARVDVAGTIPSGVLLTAFKSPSDGTIAIVAVNPSMSAVNLPVFLSGAAPSQVTPWVTSASQNLVAGTSIAVSGSAFSASLAAQSVTTFVSKP